MNENLRPLSPFQEFCVKFLGYVPSSYDDCMTYLECLIYTYNYLKNEIVPTVTQQNVVIQEMKDYIDNYFTNLDVQEEINNKLDQMALDGTLEEIITEYIQLKSILAFDTVADMKLADNLVDGSYAQTYGYSSLNDKGCAKYKIRTITNDDVVDESFIIELADDSLVAELILTPSMNIRQFGILNADSNVATKLQNIIDNTTIEEIDLVKQTLLINTTVTLKSNLTIKNGTISSNNLAKVFDGTSFENVKIDNIAFNGNENCQCGIYLTTCKNIDITNCKFYDFEILTTSCCGINTHSCSYVTIKNCEAYNIGKNSTADTSKAPRGFILENSNNVIIDGCFVHDIYSSNNHGDGIHFMSPYDRGISKNIVKNCVIQDCNYRGFKLQQRGITIENCKIIAGTNDRTLNQSAIAVYDSDITIRNNYIEQKADQYIAIGDTSADTDVSKNVLIEGNTFKFLNSVYYGVITSSGLARLVEDITIIHNNFIIDDVNEHPYGILITGDFNNVTINENHFEGGDSFVTILKKSGVQSQSKTNLIVNNNSGKTKKNLVTFGDNLQISYGSILGNSVYYTAPLSFVQGQNIINTSDITLLTSFAINENVMSCSDPSIYFHNGLRRIGTTSGRPTSAAPDGFVYFDTYISKPVTFYNGNWYLADGTISS